MADRRDSLIAERAQALNIADDLIEIAEVYGTECRDHVRRALAANPDLHWIAVVDLTLAEWERTHRLLVNAGAF